MKVVVVGAGVVGLTTAHALAIDGADVCVLDRAAVPGADASAVNAGLVAPGHLSWNAPAVVRGLPAIAFGRHDHLEVARTFDPELVRWGVRFVRSCTPSTYRRTTLVRWSLARWSLALLDELIDREAIACNRTRGGVLLVHRDVRGLYAQWDALTLLTRHGEELALLDARKTLAREPALAPHGIAGAVHARQALSADCGAFTRGLAEVCAARGVEVACRAGADRLVGDSRLVRGVRTADGRLHPADAVVVAAGSRGRALLGASRRDLPVYPVQRHGLTWEDVGDVAPRLPGVDETAHVGWAPYGDRLRVTGGAAFAGHDPPVDRRRASATLAAAQRLFPGLASRAEPSVHAGLRAMTPDGLPRVGPLGAENLFVNTGHGNLGWTLAAGSARLLADQIAGRAVEPTYRALLPGRRGRFARPTRVRVPLRVRGAH